MRASSRDFASALAVRLNRILPPGWNIVARDDRLDVYVGNELDFTSENPTLIEDADDSESLQDRLETAVYGVLSSVQDSISEQLTRPWPSADGRTMALPGVRSDGLYVHMWYGEDESEPVIGLAVIPLSEIGGSNRP
jgi:hypothetical protein